VGAVGSPASQDEVTIRLAGASDMCELVALAALDSASILEGEVIVAELGSRIVAAKPLDGGPAIADPFVRTTALVQLLEVRSKQLRVAAATNKPSMIDRVRVLRERLAVLGS